MCDGTCLWSQLFRRLRWEDRLSLGGLKATVSHNHTTALQPEQESETLFQKRKKERSGEEGRKEGKEEGREGLDTVAHTCNPSTLGDQDWQITRSRDGDHPGQHGKTPTLLKIQKVAGYGGMCL